MIISTYMYIYDRSSAKGQALDTWQGAGVFLAFDSSTFEVRC